MTKSRTPQILIKSTGIEQKVTLPPHRDSLNSCGHKDHKSLKEVNSSRKNPWQRKKLKTSMACKVLIAKSTQISIKNWLPTISPDCIKVRSRIKCTRKLAED